MLRSYISVLVEKRL